MKAVLISVVLAVTVFLASAQGEPACYDYEDVFKVQTEACTKCRESNKERPDMCLYKAWDLTDKDGNLVLSALKEFYDDGLEPSKKDAVRNAVKDCGKDSTGPFTDKKVISDLWKCADKAVTTVCPDYADFLTQWNARADLRECFGYE